MMHGQNHIKINMHPTLFHKTGLISIQEPDDRSTASSQNLL